ncbi:MAG TPA: tetratricopeptide repeat protein [Pyrinomonadaceae bacterium]|nr:tetratricopeptide repeat protein [Pyrinomonadaceae bacterium]
MKVVLPVLLALLFTASPVLAQQTDRDLGISLYREGKFSEAIQLLEKSVATQASDPAAWMFLGGAYVHTGEKEKAASAFGKSRGRPVVAQPKFQRTVGITHKPSAGYTEAARRKMQSGSVRIAIELRADGTIGFVFALPTTLDRELISESLNAAKGMKFEPAIQNEKPVTVIKFAEYTFFTR